MFILADSYFSPSGRNQTEFTLEEDTVTYVNRMDVWNTVGGAPTFTQMNFSIKEFFSKWEQFRR